MMVRKPLRAALGARRGFEAANCIDFDAALKAYQDGNDPAALLRAAGKIIDCNLPIALEHADTISIVTDNLNIEIETYGDAAHAIRRWLFQISEPGAEH